MVVEFFEVVVGRCRSFHLMINYGKTHCIRHELARIQVLTRRIRQEIANIRVQTRCILVKFASIRVKYPGFFINAQVTEFKYKRLVSGINPQV